MYTILLLLLSGLTNAHELDNPKYKGAIKTATEAAFKQSGLESDFILVKSKSKSKLNKFIKDNGLQTTAAVVGFIYPIAIKHKLRIKSGNFIFQGNEDKKEVTWNIQF